MKEDEALEMVKKNCSEKYAVLSKQFASLSQDFKIAKDIPAFMELKVKGMLTALNLPVRSDYCPFCTMAKLPDNNYNCADCWYAKTHGGECGEDEGGDYDNIIKFSEVLEDAVFNYWTIEDTTDWNNREVFYKVGDVIHTTILFESADVSNIERNVMISGLGNNIIQLFSTTDDGSYPSKQFKVEDIYKISKSELSGFISHTGREVAIKLIHSVDV